MYSSVANAQVNFWFGGEEFLVIFPDTTLDVARKRCEQLRDCVEQFEWQRIQPNLRITMSIGLAISQPFESVEQIISHADQMLYKAKSGGRNQVVVA